METFAYCLPIRECLSHLIDVPERHLFRKISPCIIIRFVTSLLQVYVGFGDLGQFILDMEPFNPAVIFDAICLFAWIIWANKQRERPNFAALSLGLLCIFYG